MDRAFHSGDFPRAKPTALFEPGDDSDSTKKARPDNDSDPRSPETTTHTLFFTTTTTVKMENERGELVDL